MRTHQAEMLTRLVRNQEALEIRRGAELRAIAHGLIQDNLGRNHRVINMQNFYSALVRALMTAREQGQADCSGEDVLTLT